MAPLLYKEDFDAARDRLTTWWNGGDIGRAAVQLFAPREKPLEDLPPVPNVEVVTHYTTRSFEWRYAAGLHAFDGSQCLAEAIPAISPDLAPNTLALYLGCKGVESPGTVWCEPFLDDPDQARFELDPNNFYWQFTLRLGDAWLRQGRGKFLIAFPDLIEGLDTLAAMRGTEQTLMDLIERPTWVEKCLEQITDRYFDAYGALYERYKDDRGGSHFWAWAPGKMSKLQCDFSAMLSPEMFERFMVPMLTRMTGYLDNCMYHWDGVCALQHEKHLLALPRLRMIQWTPGANQPAPHDRKWWPLLHRCVDAGKKVILLSGCGIEDIQALKREFGRDLRHFMINAWVNSAADAPAMLDAASV